MGEAAALIAAFTWSATSVALTSLSARTSPVVLSGLRLAAATCLLPFILLASGQFGDIQDASALSIFSMVGSGLVGYGLGDTLYIRALSLVGMQRTFTITMALFIGLTVIGGVVLLDEPFSWGLPAGAVLIGAGVWLTVARGAGSGASAPALSIAEPGLAGFADLPGAPGPESLAPAHGGALLQGYLIMLGAAVFWAIATLWLASGRGSLGAVAAGSLRTPAGAVGLVAFALATQPRNLLAPFSDRRHVTAIVISGVAGTAFGSLLYVYAVGEAGAARTAVLNATAPVMALPLSVLFLGERLTIRVGAGTAACVLGILLVVS